MAHFVHVTRVKRAGPASVASFDFSDKMDLEFTCHDQIPRAVAIRSRSFGIEPTVEIGGDEASIGTNPLDNLYV